MYVGNHKQSKGTKAFGAVAAVALTVGMGGLFTAMNFNAERMERISSELVLIQPPPPPVIEEPPPPQIVEEAQDTPAPPTPAPLVAPEIEFVPDVIAVITAPVVETIPEPAPIIAAPVVQSRSAARLIASDKPAYPTASQRAGEQGTTQLDVCVASNGRVTSATVSRSSGHPRLDDAAAKWIRGERFQPAKINGAAQAVCGHKVVYEWSLRDA